MKYKQFERLILAIQESDKERDNFNDALSPFNDGWTIITLGYNLTKAVINYLEDVFNDKCNYIDWWLYEDVEKVIYENDKQIKVKTIRQLYDFLMKNKGDNK
jgi:hypothetical protein